MTGAIFLNCPSNMHDEALLEERLAQDMPNTHRFGPCRDILVGVTRYEDNRSGDVAVAQPAGQIDAIYVGHFVVDHKAVDAGRTHRAEQRRAGSERSNVESVRFEKKPQRAKNVGVVVDHIDGGFAADEVTIACGWFDLNDFIF